MKTILSKTKQETFLNDNWKLSTLYFKWTTSKAKDSYGYNVCTLKDTRDNKISKTIGGGYDMKGTALGYMINEYLQDEIQKINTKKYYGLTHYNSKTKKRQDRASKHTKSYVDGGCGFNTMVDILNKIGFNVKFIRESNNSSTYLLQELPRKHYSRTILR